MAHVVEPAMVVTAPFTTRSAASMAGDCVANTPAFMIMFTMGDAMRNMRRP